MQLHELRNKKRNKKRIARGGAHGKTSGRGTKGQKSRAGHRIRPAERDLIKKLPKLRGYRFKGIGAKHAVVNLSAMNGAFASGDVVLHPPGEAHQITNASATEELTFLLIADNPPVDYWHYPDSGKWGLRAPRTFFRMNEVDYWDGEE